MMSLNAIIQIVMELFGCLFCLIMTVTLSHDRNRGGKSKRYLFWMNISTAVLLLSDAFAWIFRGYDGILGYYMVRISNFAVFFEGYVIIIFYTLYLNSKLTESEQKKTKVWIRAIFVICITGMVLLAVNCINGMYYYFDADNFYHRAAGYPPLLIIGLIPDIIDLFILIRNRKSMSIQGFLSFLSYLLLPGAAMVALFFYYGISLTNIAILISMIYMAMVSYRENYEKMLAQEKELSEMKEKMLISQIGPHFIYNSLSTIKHLCRTDPEEAVNAIDEFASFLRSNIDSLGTADCISFEDEVEHVKNYIALEKRRFGDRVNVIWALDDKNFMIPAMTLQPIVENAVKHGITKRQNGGTISIYSKNVRAGEASSFPDYYEIAVEDDGVGFNTDAVCEDDGCAHIGISNVRKRLELMCGGSLTVTSAEGKGTRAVIIIPVKG